MTSLEDRIRSALARHSTEARRRREPVLGRAPKDVARGPDGRPRSVVFLHQSYYHFLYLAAALRRRGWDALAVTVEPPDSPHAPFYHGEDVNLFDSDAAVLEENLAAARAEMPARFRMLHFSGDGWMTLDPRGQDMGPRREAVPWDILAFKKAGMKVGYSVSGCTDGIAQSSYYRWSEGCCDKCALKHKPETCSDLRNLAWGHKREMFCDLIAGETLPALDYSYGPKVYREPLTMGMDPTLWRPDIEVPSKYRIERAPGEILIYHGVGNYYHEHYSGRRDHKGTGAIMAAVERLRAEGHPVRLVFVHDVPSRDMRFIQVQADITVDQLNAGRYGANARECLMLGKPVVGNLRRDEPDGAAPLQSLADCPIIHATEETVEAVLRELILDPERRRRLGAASRAYALKWHSADALAARFEAVYDHLMAGGRPCDAPVVVPDPMVLSGMACA